MKEISEILKEIGNTIKEAGIKVKASCMKLVERIRNRKKPDVFQLINRFFYGIGHGIQAGIRAAIHSWKYERENEDSYKSTWIVFAH